MAEDRQTQCTGMLSREQLLCLFERFDSQISQPDVKKRIADAVNDQQEAVAVTTAIQEEVFLEMGVGHVGSLLFAGLWCFSDCKKRLKEREGNEESEHLHQIIAFFCHVDLWFFVNGSLTSHRRICQVFLDPGFGIGCLGKVNMVYENDRELMIRFYGFVAKEEMACDEAELGPDEFAEKICSQHKLQEQQLEMLKYMRKFHVDDQSAVLEKLHEQMQNANFDSRASIMSVDRIEEFVRTRSTPMARPSQHG